MRYLVRRTELSTRAFVASIMDLVLCLEDCFGFVTTAHLHAKRGNKVTFQVMFQVHLESENCYVCNQ